MKLALFPFAVVLCMFVPQLWPIWVFGWLFIAVFA